MEAQAIEIQVGTLTAMDIKALKQADSVSFHYSRDDLDSTGVGGSYIRASKEIRNNPFETSRDYRIDVTSKFQTYSNHNGRGISKEEIKFAYEWFSHCKYDDVWFTFTQIIRVGDVVSLLWVTDNNNQLVDEADLHCDSFKLVVQRGEKRLTFLMETSVSKDNTARMVRRW